MEIVRIALKLVVKLLPPALYFFIKKENFFQFLNTIGKPGRLNIGQQTSLESSDSSLNYSFFFFIVFQAEAFSFFLLFLRNSEKFQEKSTCVWEADRHFSFECRRQMCLNVCLFWFENTYLDKILNYFHQNLHSCAIQLRLFKKRKKNQNK